MPMTDSDDTNTDDEASKGGCLEDATDGALRVSKTHTQKSMNRMMKVNNRLKASDDYAQEAYDEGFVMHLMEVRYHLEQMDVALHRELEERNNDQ